MGIIYDRYLHEVLVLWNVKPSADYVQNISIQAVGVNNKKSKELK